MIELYTKVAFNTNRLITQTYSTSFSIAVSFFDKSTKEAIYNIYGFVRFADEIVDTFHDFEQEYLLSKFEQDYYEAYRTGISLNPVLHAFQLTVKKYNIPDNLIQAFLLSMKADLHKKDYSNKAEIAEYIYGSAEVVGLMCLRVFANNNDKYYSELESPAMELGAAFQKVNFLRDLKNDIELLDRRYFPEYNKDSFNEKIKQAIIQDIEADFNSSYSGIKRLPQHAKLAVLIAFYYYIRLLNKIKNTPANDLQNKCIRVSDSKKMFLLAKAVILCKLRLV